MHLVKMSAAGSLRLIEPYHDRIREVATSGLDAAAKCEWHRRLAMALESSSVRDPEALAIHWERAGEEKRAQVLYREAAQRANSQMAFDRAAELYQRSLALLDSDAPQRPDMEIELAEAFANAGRGEEAGTAFARLAEQRKGHLAIELQSRASRAFLTSGRFEEGMKALHAAMRAVDLPIPKTQLGILFLIIWYRLLLQIRGFKLKERDPKTLDPETRVRINTCWAAGHGPSMSHPMAGAIFHAYGTRLALDYGDPALALRALCGHANSMSTGGYKARKKTAEVIHHIEELRRGQSGPYIEAFTAGAHTFAAFMLEDWQKARGYCEAAEATFRDRCVGTTYELSTARLLHARILGWLGRLTELEAYAIPILRDAVRRNDLYGVINMRANACVLLAVARDDLPAMKFELDEVVKSLPTQGFQLQHVYWLTAAAAVDIYEGEAGAVLARFETYRKPLARSLIMHMPSQRVVVNSLIARAHLTLAQASANGRALNLEAASRYARGLQAEGTLAARAVGTLIHAGVLSMKGERDNAIEQLKRAISEFERADMRLHVACAGYVLSTLVEPHEADALRRNAEEVFAEQHVLLPKKFSSLYAPGFAL
jgi:tetratricopeptide (TPR) repeat protein